MTWNVPPVGWCAKCLLEKDDAGDPVKKMASTIYNGTSMCITHLEKGVEARRQMSRITIPGENDN